MSQRLSSRTVREGSTAGALGAISVALWFLLGDAAAGRPFYTPAVLGSALLHGADGPDAVLVTAQVVTEYSLLHIAVFLALGVLLAEWFNRAEKEPPLLSGLLILFLVVETLFVAAVSMLGGWIILELGWASILVGNLLAAVSIGGYLGRCHPALRDLITGTR